MKEVARFIYDNPDDPVTEILVHGLHDKESDFLKYSLGRSISTVYNVAFLLGMGLSQPSNTLHVTIYMVIRSNKKEILREFSKLFKI